MMGRVKLISFYTTVGAFIFYALSLSHGISIYNLALSAKLTAWDWEPLVGHPLLWLLTQPIRLLPTSWIPSALNLLTALFAATTLGLLTRCWELLPWPRPLSTLPVWQRHLPLLLGLLACGLELHFWQAATAATGEILAALLCALPLWCLLEFRRDIFTRGRWLGWLTFTWGLAVAENRLMLFSLPLLITGLVVFDPLGLVLRDHWRRMTIGLVAGLGIYLVPPLIQSLWPGTPWSAGETWLITLRQTKHELAGVSFQFFLAHRLMGLLVVIFFLLPGLACLVRLHDENPSGKMPADQLQIWCIRGLRLVLLLFCLWLALDPTVSPRALLQGQMHLPLPLLTFDFFNGLGIAYLAGMLLFMHRRAAPGAPAPFDPFEIKLLTCLEPLAAPLVLALTLGLGTLLVARNFPSVQETNRQPLIAFGQQALASLPVGGGIVLADDSSRLWAFQAAQAHTPTTNIWLPVDVNALPNLAYRRQLARRHPGPWLLNSASQPLAPIELIQLMDGLVRSNRVFYLHPSFSFLFDGFYLKPVGAVYELKPFLTNTVAVPPPTTEQIAQNEQGWSAWQPHGERLLRSAGRNTPSWLSSLEKKLHLRPVVFEQSQLLREWSSLALNTWGVTLQRAGQPTAAHSYLLEARALNPDNWIAEANLFCNTNLMAQRPMTLEGADRLASQFSDLKRFNYFLNRFGPVDDPAFCFVLGNDYAQQGQLRQAMQQFKRSAQLAPHVLGPQFALASLYLRCGLPDQADTLIKQLRAEVKTLPQASTLDGEISFFEANLWLAQTNAPAARRILLALAHQHRDEPATAERVWQALTQMGDLTNALAVVNDQLAIHPNDSSLQLTQAGLLLQTGQSAQAVPVLDQLLARTNLPAARLNRAIARLQLHEYSAAREDFLVLQDSALNPFAIQFGLAEAALGAGDTNSAREYFRQCLSNAPPESIQWKTAQARLRTLP